MKAIPSIFKCSLNRICIEEELPVPASLYDNTASGAVFLS